MDLNDAGDIDFYKFESINGGQVTLQNPTSRIFDGSFLVKELRDDHRPIPTVTAYQYNDSGRIHSMVTEMRDETSKTREVTTFKYDCK